MGRTAGTVVLLIDVAKGVVPVYLAGWWLGSGGAQVLAGIGAIAGHVFTPFLGFRGGKGVATGAGVFLALAPLAFLTGFCVWGLLVLLTRYVSVGSIGAAVATPLFLLWQRTFLQPELSPAVVSFGFLAGLLIVLRHIPNLRRLAGGTENRIGRKQVSESGKG
jgi:glycerol-3-phosphate acyltransferase PlsY